MTKFINPYYLVDFNSSLCSFEIYINDIPAYIHNSGGIIASHYPINNYILENGEQKIKLKILPLEGQAIIKEDASIKVKVHAYDEYTKDYKSLIEVFNFENPDLSKPKLPLLEIEAKFIAEVSYKIEGWKNSQILKDGDKVKDELISFYKEIHELAKSQNSAKLYQLLKTRFDEIDTSMYIRNEDNMLGLNNMFNDLNAGNFILQDFPESSKILHYGENRIINLLRSDNNPILYYLNKSNHEEFSLPLFIHKKTTSSKFEVIR